MTEYAKRKQQILDRRHNETTDSAPQPKDKDKDHVSSKPYWKGCKPMNPDDPDTIEFEVKVSTSPLDWLWRRR